MLFNLIVRLNVAIRIKYCSYIVVKDYSPKIIINGFSFGGFVMLAMENISKNIYD